MDHSVTAYIQRTPTAKLEDFLQKCEKNGTQEDYGDAIVEIQKELKRRKEEKLL